MRDLKNFYLNYFNGTLCSRSTLDAKNYFYDFFGTNSYDTKEESKLENSISEVTNFYELKLINKRLFNIKSINIRNSHIVRETENEQNSLLKKGITNDLIIQAVWLKNLLKYYKEQETYILKDYGKFVLNLAKFINTHGNEAIEYFEYLFKFGDEYKNVILFAINALGDIKCNLIHDKKINHALHVGFETYLTGNLTNDAVATSILLDVLQYSYDNNIKDKIKDISNKYNTQKILDIFLKSGLNPDIQQKSWKERKQYQIEMISRPGSSSFSALCILLISKKINLVQICEYFNNIKFEYLKKNKDCGMKKLNLYISNVKKEFWNKYSGITEDDAKEYYSKIYNICIKQSNIPSHIIDEYELLYFNVFDEYPL